jgi:hypothetical protein
MFTKEFGRYKIEVGKNYTSVSYRDGRWKNIDKYLSMGFAPLEEESESILQLEKRIDRTRKRKKKLLKNGEFLDYEDLYYRFEQEFGVNPSLRIVISNNPEDKLNRTILLCEGTTLINPDVSEVSFSTPKTFFHEAHHSILADNPIVHKKYIKKDRVRVRYKILDMLTPIPYNPFDNTEVFLEAVADRAYGKSYSIPSSPTVVDLCILASSIAAGAANPQLGILPACAGGYVLSKIVFKIPRSIFIYKKYKNLRKAIETLDNKIGKRETTKLYMTLRPNEIEEIAKYLYNL